MEALPLVTVTTTEAQPELHSILLRNPSAIDLAQHNISLDDFGCNVLRSHLMHFWDVRTINLTGCSQLTGKGYSYLAEAAEFGATLKLEHIALGAMHPPAVEFTRLLQSLQRHSPVLSSLIISDNELGDEVADRLSSAMPLNLVTLDVSGNRLTGKGLTRLFQALQQRRSPLEELHVSGNAFSYRASQTLAALLTSGNRHATLRVLGLRHCRLDEVISIPIAQCFARCDALDTVDLSDNDMALSFALPVGSAAGTLFPPRATVLNFSRNVIKGSVVRSLCNALRPCCDTMRELYLAHSLVGDDCCGTFFDALPRWPALTTLDLSDCALTFKSGALFKTAVPQMALLERLLLNDNVFHIDGAHDLAVAVGQMRRLATLQLSNCHLGNKGTLAVAQGIVQSVSPLKEVFIAKNGIDNAGMADLCEVFSRLTCAKLALLDFSFNDFTDAAAAYIDEMVRQRQSACVIYTNGTRLEEEQQQQDAAEEEEDEEEDEEEEEERQRNVLAGEGGSL